MAKLRAKASAALKIHPSGVSAMLRLSLAQPMESDPGFYQLWQVLLDARRLCGKSLALLHDWRQFMSSYDGGTYHGPFSKLILTLSQVQWSVQWPPMLLDHRGRCHDLLLIPSALLRLLAEEAWLEYVSSQHRHRKTMRQLHGIHGRLAKQVRMGLSPVHSARVASVQAGAFVFSAAHAKYDATKDGLCVLCQVPGTVEHRLRYCTAFSAARRQHQWICDAWDDYPDCVTHHMLPPANPHLPAVQQLLMDLPDLTGDFHCSGLGSGLHHLFTDGSCVQGSEPALALAAWAVVDATSNKAVACGPVCGILQTAPRAEMYVLIASLRWMLRMHVAAIVWSDALNLVSGVRCLLQADGFDPEENEDLWCRIGALLDQLTDSQLRIQHIPSHLDPTRTTGPFEDWIACWNGRVDHLAGLTNSNRTQRFAAQYSCAQQYHDRMAQALPSVRELFLAIAHSQWRPRTRMWSTITRRFLLKRHWIRSGIWLITFPLVGKRLFLHLARKSQGNFVLTHVILSYVWMQITVPSL